MMGILSTYPSTYTDTNETGCCPVPDVSAWDRRTIDLNQRFIRRHTRSLVHIPMNMGSVMTALQADAEAAGATMPPDHGMILSHDLSAWRAEQLYAVSAPVEGADNVVLEGTFATRVFEGPYGRAREWHEGIIEYARSLGREVSDVYFFYTTCPACAKHYGANYVIVLGRIV
jgi:hypothetical protein